MIAPRIIAPEIILPRMIAPKIIDQEQFSHGQMPPKNIAFRIVFRSSKLSLRKIVPRMNYVLENKSSME